MLKIKRALISVSDKTGILELAALLHKFQVEILSTGGTARLLRENNIPVKEVSEYTGFPEILNGRIKTLHPKIHGGLLARREDPRHLHTLQEQGIGLIDMVVVNLYPFEQTVANPAVKIEEAIENIDIGGPSMLRSAAKNYCSVAVVCAVEFYPQVIRELKKNQGSLPPELLRSLAAEVFRRTSQYDAAISGYLSEKFAALSQPAKAGFPGKLTLEFSKVQDLRYGENPHQRAAFYRDTAAVTGLAGIRQLWGKELSFNNLLDLNAAVNIVREFSHPAAVFIKHNNPCGVAEDKDILKAYKEAWSCDKLSAFGGIVSVNRKIDLDLAGLISRSGFLECVICPSFDPKALGLLKEKKNLRLLELPAIAAQEKEMDFKKVSGGLLLQDNDAVVFEEKALRVVTKKKPTAKELDSLVFAWKVAKHVKSNAIVLCRGSRTVGIGAGQMSRVDAVFISTKKAGSLAAGSVLASDAFFPKEDAVQLAARYKIKAIIQPGGSLADEAIIRMADRHKLAMVFTGTRHFRH